MSLPKVSCILATGYGDRFFRVALSCFQAQDYAGELELVVVDNNYEPLGNLLPADPRIKYVRSARMSVGALRNYGTARSTGEICCTWDEDDFYAANRVSVQVERLLASGKAVTGWHNVFYYDLTTHTPCKYFLSPNGQNHAPYAIGMSQMYRREWWEKHQFAESGIEDLPFSEEANRAGQLDSCDAGHLCVATIHDRNVCSKRNLAGRHRQWPSVELSALPEQFFAVLEKFPQ